MAANMQAWMTGDERREDIDARQDALDDRLHSKGDRASSAIDRSVLADIDNSDDPQ
jgi:hypothetical protein